MLKMLYWPQSYNTAVQELSVLAALNFSMHLYVHMHIIAYVYLLRPQ